MLFSLPFFISLVAAAKPPAFIFAGDSTTAVQTKTGGGWGTGFLSTLISPAKGSNHGANGATTVSFVKDGKWSAVMAEVEDSTADFDVFVTIQFGHNDEKPAKNISLDLYQMNLENLAKDVLSAGATPILITPLNRRSFTNGTVTDNLWQERLGTYAAAAATSGARLLDLNLASRLYLTALGETAAQTYNLAEGDRTHLSAWGSVVFGRVVADMLLGHQPVVPWLAQAEWVPAGPFVDFIALNETLSATIWAGALA
ncbi:unnamed protein product [Discula destructiva]